MRFSRNSPGGGLGDSSSGIRVSRIFALILESTFTSLPDVAAVRDAISGSVGGQYRLVLQTNAEYRGEVQTAIKQSFRQLGYPTIALPCLMAKDPIEEALLAAAFIVKYAAIVVLSDFDRRTLLPLLAQRLNIYTDPRMPLSVKEGIYEIGEPKPDSD